jgi:gluconate 2-dehydrogenase alpha chain
MAKRMKQVDAVMVGMGWTGTIMARELTKAGLSVVGLERGAYRAPAEDFALPGIRDELKYRLRFQLMLDNGTETITMRHAPDETAMPMRRWGAFPLGDGLGGAGTHWNGVTWRTLPTELVLRSHLEQRYGKNAIPADLTIQDWGVTYDDLEPHFDRFEKLCGTSGKAGNLKGRIVEGGNPFEGPRQNEYPNKPLIMSQAGLIFSDAAKKVGFHPFPTPSSNVSAAYTNPEGQTLGACQYCGHCEYFGCESNSKASPNITIMPVLMRDPRFELRTHAYVKNLVYDKQAKKVRGVVYIDRETGEEIEQPADLVVLCAYPFNNVSLLLSAGIGTPYDPRTAKGVVGKNFCLQVMSNVQIFVKDEINPFIGTGVNPAAVDDFQGDNFDHSGLGFFGGGYLYPAISGGRPIQVRATPPGTPRWGSKWKEETVRWYNHNFPIGCHGASYAWRTNYLDLDPNYKDAIGRPLVRMTYNYTPNDRKMSQYLTDRAVEMARAANATIVGTPNPRTGNFDNIIGQSSHHTGGAIMGTDPSTSAINRYLQNWEASNLFVMGGAAFPQNPGYNPTGTIAALAFWSAHAITTQYLKNPGPLMQS